jgi:hypothetical protein
MTCSIVKTAFFLIIFSWVATAGAGMIYCKTETLPNGKRHYIFTNSNVNIDDSFRILDYGEHAQEVDNPKSVGTIPYRAMKNSTYQQTEKNNPYDDKAKEIMDKITFINSNLSNDLMTKKYQLLQIEALNKTLRTLTPLTSYGKGISNKDTEAREREDTIEEQKVETQRIKAQAQSEANRARSEADQAKREIDQARLEADQAKREAQKAQWETDRIRIDNIINNKW